MRKVFLIVLALFLFPQISQGQQYGFKDVLFGDNFETAWDKADKQGILSLHDDIIKKFARKYRIINCYCPIGGVKMAVKLFFDDQMKFYKFEMRDGKGATDVHGLDSTVKSQVDFLLELFKAKYGEPTKCFSYPNVLKLEAWAITPVCIWLNLNIQAQVGVYETDVATFIGKASVADIKLLKSFTERKKRKVKDGAKSGAKDF